MVALTTDRLNVFDVGLLGLINSWWHKGILLGWCDSNEVGNINNCLVGIVLGLHIGRVEG